MHPYREAYIPPVQPPAPKKHPREIIKLAEEAIKHFASSCPDNPLIVVGFEKPYWFFGKTSRGMASPHGMKPATLSGSYFTPSEPCCAQYRLALKEVNTLTRFWTWVANRRLKKELVNSRLVQYDTELMSLLLPYAPKVIPDFVMYHKYRPKFQKCEACNGSGAYEVPFTQLEIHWYDCEKCDGTGDILVQPLY